MIELGCCCFFSGSVALALSFASVLIDVLLIKILGTTSTRWFVPLILSLLVFPLKAAAWYRLRSVASSRDESPQGNPLRKSWLFGMRAELYYHDYQARVYRARSSNIVGNAARASKSSRRDSLNSKATKLDRRAQKALTKSAILSCTLSESNLAPANHYGGFIYSIFHFLGRNLDSKCQEVNK